MTAVRYIRIEGRNYVLATYVAEMIERAMQTQTKETQGMTEGMTDAALPNDEIVRELKRFRYDRSRRIPLKVFGDHVGLHKNTLCAYINGTIGPSEPARAKLSAAITAIRDGRLKFVRHGKVWHAEGKAMEAI